MKNQLLTKQEESQKQFYDRQFKEVNNYQLASWQKSYIKRIKESMLKRDYKNKTLLDVATGSGYVGIEMAKLGINVIASDLSPESIRNLNIFKKQLKLNNLKLLVCRAQKIPLKSNSVDYIVANAIIEHIQEEQETITEWKRILKPKGSMFITTPIKYRHIWPFFIPLNFIHDKWIGHLRRYDLETLKNKFQLPVTKVYYTGHFTKMMWLLLSRIKKQSLSESEIEIEDAKKQEVKYGSSNIIVVFKKDK